MKRLIPIVAAVLCSFGVGVLCGVSWKTDEPIPSAGRRPGMVAGSDSSAIPVRMTAPTESETRSPATAWVSDKIQALQTLALSAPEKAARQAWEIEDPVLRRLCLVEAYSAWLSRDRLSAAEWLVSLPRSPERDALALRAAETFLYHDLRLATNNALAISDATARQHMLSRIRAYWDREEGFESTLDVPAAAPRLVESVSAENSE